MRRKSFWEKLYDVIYAIENHAAWIYWFVDVEQILIWIRNNKLDPKVILS